MHQSINPIFKFILIVCLAFFLTTQIVFAQTEPTSRAEAEARAIEIHKKLVEDRNKRDNKVACPDFEETGIQVALKSSVITAVAGTKARFEGQVENKHPFTVTNAKVIIKIFEVDTARQVFKHTIDKFEAETGLNIDPNNKARFSFEWNVPLFAKSGTYAAIPYIIYDQHPHANFIQQNQDIQASGAAYFFKLDAESSVVRFDDETFELNGQKFEKGIQGQIIKLTNNEDISLSVDLLNPLKKEVQIPVQWKLYAWDSIHERNLIEEGFDMYTIGANGKLKIKKQIQNNIYAQYQLVIEAVYKDTKSIIEVPFARSDVQSIGAYTLNINGSNIEAGIETKISSCLMYFEGESKLTDARLVISLKDVKGEKIFGKETTGSLFDLQNQSISFIPEKMHNQFILSMEVLSGNASIYSHEIVYCKNGQGDDCVLAEEEKSNHIPILIIGGLLIFFPGLIYAVRRRKSGIVVSMLIVFSLFSYNIADARSEYVDIDNKLIFDFKLPFNDLGDPSPDAPDLAVGWKRWWPCMKIEYHTKITKENNPAFEFSGNDQFFTGPDPLVSVGDRLRVEFIPFRPAGGVMAFPHSRIVISQNNSSPLDCNTSWSYPYLGFWKYSLTEPDGWIDAIEEGWVAPNIRHWAYSSIFDPSGGGIQLGFPPWTPNRYEHDVYNIFPFVARVPPLSIEGVSGLSCEPLLPDNTTICTATQPGIATIDMRFGPTTGKFYLAQNYVIYDEFNNQIGGSPMVEGEMLLRGATQGIVVNEVVQIPTKLVHYDINVTGGTCSANTAPATPTITGPTNGVVETYYDFTVVSTDVNDNPLSYQIDWNNDSVADETYPTTGTIPAGQSFTVSKAWSSIGVKNVRVRAVDACAQSSWSSYPIQINDIPAVAISCTGTPNIASIGQEVVWNGIVAPSDTTIYTAWDWTGDSNGSGQTISDEYFTAGVKNMQVTATHAGGTKSAQCSVQVQTCSPGSPGCQTSCGTAEQPVAIGSGINISSPLCAAGATYITGSLVPAWAWTCRGLWQNNTERCTTCCAAGSLYDASTDTCSATPADLCMNIPGLQTDASAYTVSCGQCTFNSARINYFRFNPDTAKATCPAYWSTTQVSGLRVECKIGGVTVPSSHPDGSAANQLYSVGKRHTLTCEAYDPDDILLATFSSQAKCNAVGTVIER